jgi:hypothetical protein
LLPLAILAAAAIDAASIAQNSATLQALGPHPFGSPRNQAAAQFLAAKLQEAGLSQASVDAFTVDGIFGSNVIANLPGRSDRLVILATHHDTNRDGSDLAARSRAMAVLVELGKQASRLRPAKTWILASFDGGESKGEGLAHYLDTLGRSQSMLDGVILLDGGPPQDEPVDPTLIAPACPDGPGSNRRAIGGADFVSAALAQPPENLDFSFDDPGIGLLTQPFIRTFRTRCDPTAARALETGIGALIVTDRSYSRAFLANGAAAKPADPPLKDEVGARLGRLAFAAIQGVDATPFPPRQSNAWLVAGRTLWPGWLLFALGCASLIPGLFALRANSTGLGLRGAYSLLFLAGLYYEPEFALFAGLLPTLVPVAFPRQAFLVALAPLAVLLAAGGLSFARGQVIGTWLSPWMWLGVVCCVGLLLGSMVRAGKKPPAKAKRGRK